LNTQSLAPKSLPTQSAITIDGAPKTIETKLETNADNWDFKFNRVLGKSAEAVKINKKQSAHQRHISKAYNG